MKQSVGQSLLTGELLVVVEPHFGFCDRCGTRQCLGGCTKCDLPAWNGRSDRQRTLRRMVYGAHRANSMLGEITSFASREVDRSSIAGAPSTILPAGQLFGIGG